MVGMRQIARSCRSLFSFDYKRRHRNRARRLFLEPLETRLPLAAPDVTLTGMPGQNSVNPFDTNNDGWLVAGDVLGVINHAVESTGSGEAPAGSTGGYYDVNGDGIIDSTDVALIASYIGSLPSGSSSSSSSSSYYPPPNPPTYPPPSPPPTPTGCNTPTVTASATAAVGEGAIFTVSVGWTEGTILLVHSEYLKVLTTSGVFGGFTAAGVWGAGINLNGSATLTVSFSDDYPVGTPSDVLPIGIEIIGLCEAPPPLPSVMLPLSVQINNVVPTVTVAGTAELDEGNEASLSVTLTDAGTNDDYELALDWGDGTVETWVVQNQSNFGPAYGPGGMIPNSFTYSRTLTHRYLDDDPTNTSSDIYDVTLSYKDHDMPNSLSVPRAIRVNNVDPTVTIDSVEVVDAVLATDAAGNPTEWLNAGQLDESESLIVHGTVTDPGINDTFPIRYLARDLNYDGDLQDAGEQITLALQSVSPGHWIFDQTIGPIQDDGVSPGNGTPADILPLYAVVHDDDLGHDGAVGQSTVYNYPPRFNDTPQVQYIFDGEGVNLLSVKVTGSFTDYGSQDVHTVRVEFGNGQQSVDVLTQGARDFEIVHSFGPSGTDDFLSIFPVVTKVLDDDTGVDTRIKNFACSDLDASAIDVNGVQFVGGRGTFFDVFVDAHNSSDGFVGVDFGMKWNANKPAFIGKGVCQVGVVQIAKKEANFSGLGGLGQEWWDNYDWHVDKSVPYPFALVPERPTATNPFSKGKLSSQDSPRLDTSVIGFLGPANYCRAATFETCVVALQGHEGVAVDSTSVELVKMAVYGCVTWGYAATRQEDGTYLVTRHLQGQSTTTLTTLTSGGGGSSPSGLFINTVEESYVPNYQYPT